ncbi:hypothetical protein ElyMa_002705000 [Elysia marginata]|uniref:PHD-type domain-containing protein n=1 Tax=Elysia marginata TaxID=1093978 RepID=A0AAV4HEI6_9GAST|nr:hypothetical protein ElyMa_002705000 [Elysia marginata]
MEQKKKEMEQKKKVMKQKKKEMEQVKEGAKKRTEKKIKCLKLNETLNKRNKAKTDDKDEYYADESMEQETNLNENPCLHNYEKVERREKNNENKEERNVEMDFNRDDDEGMVEETIELELGETACYVCHMSEDRGGWIGCDTCSLWFHKKCTGAKKHMLQEMTDEELEKFRFVCIVCKRKHLF